MPAVREALRDERVHVCGREEDRGPMSALWGEDADEDEALLITEQ